MTPVRLEPTAPRSPVKHSTTEPLCSHILHVLQKIVPKCLVTRAYMARDSKPITASSREPISALA